MRFLARVRDLAQRIVGRLLGPALVIGLSGHAQAHPHVWIVARSEVVFDAAGQLTGFRHTWVFDPAYTAYMSMGLDADRDGKPDPDKLAELAKTNVESLVEFNYFTEAKVNGRKAEFNAPTDYALTLDNGRMSLRFFLPVKTPVKAKIVAFQVDDPSFFVAFNLAEDADAVTLAGSTKGCAMTVKRPPKVADEGLQILADDIAATLNGQANAVVGADYTSHILVACP